MSLGQLVRHAVVVGFRKPVPAPLSCFYSLCLVSLVHSLDSALLKKELPGVPAALKVESSPILP